MTHSSSLPPRDSPLTTMFLGQYVSALMLETVKYLKLSYARLAHEMAIPEMVLRDAVEGKMGLTRGHWVRLGKALGYWGCRQRMSYDPASRMVCLVGKSVTHLSTSPWQTRRSRLSSQLIDDPF
jgi:hypothetical protein